MSLFQSLEEAAGLGGQQGQPSAQPGVLGAVIQMVQSQPGGIGGIIQKFESAGLGGVAQSWIGTGGNHQVDGGQVQNALGPDLVGQVAARLGVSHDEASSHIAQYLPLILDHLSPGGQVPVGSGAGALGSLLAKFGV
jgi:uncharacterized protein YidB (DUF937 family)